MEIKLLAIYECYFRTGFIPEVDLFDIDKNAPIYYNKWMTLLLAGDLSHRRADLSDFIKRYTLIE